MVVLHYGYANARSGDRGGAYGGPAAAAWDSAGRGAGARTFAGSASRVGREAGLLRACQLGDAAVRERMGRGGVGERDFV